MGCSCLNGNNSINCSGITVALVTLWLNKLQCVVNSNSYGIIGLDLGTANAWISTLQNMLADKQNDVNSCNYQSYVSGITTIFNNIILNNLCP